MAEIRKASDILLTLEKEVLLLKNVINLQDVMLKTILNNCNKTNALLSSLVGGQFTIPTQATSGSPSSEKIIIPSGVPIEVETEFKGERRVTRAPSAPSTKASNADIEFKDYMAQRKMAPHPKEETKAGEVKSEKKVPIVQRVQDNNGKDLFMAEVNIKSSDESFTLKAKTNAMGKWQAQLSPGKYNVRVSKMDTVAGKKLESQQDIVVPYSNTPITLSDLIINRE